MSELAFANFCLHRVDRVFDPEGKSSRSTEKGRWNNRHLLVGRKVNVEATLRVYDYLHEAITRAARDAGYDVRVSDGKIFLEGAASRLGERLRDRRREREAEDKRRQAEAVARDPNAGRALVISDVYGTESDYNNDVINSFPLGTTATRRRELRERQVAMERHRQELINQGVKPVEAYYIAMGFGAERAAQLASEHAAQSQRQARRAARGGGRGRSQSWTAGDEKRYAKVNSPAYRAGRDAGGRVGLDEQVKSGGGLKLPKK